MGADSAKTRAQQVRSYLCHPKVAPGRSLILSSLSLKTPFHILSEFRFISVILRRSVTKFRKVIDGYLKAKKVENH